MAVSMEMPMKLITYLIKTIFPVQRSTSVETFQQELVEQCSLACTGPVTDEFTRMNSVQLATQSVPS